jgi:hypothetical protein
VITFSHTPEASTAVERYAAWQEAGRQDSEGNCTGVRQCLTPFKGGDRIDADDPEYVSVAEEALVKLLPKWNQSFERELSPFKKISTMRFSDRVKSSS